MALAVPREVSDVLGRADRHRPALKLANAMNAPRRAMGIDSSTRHAYFPCDAMPRRMFGQSPASRVR